MVDYKTFEINCRSINVPETLRLSDGSTVSIGSPQYWYAYQKRYAEELKLYNFSTIDKLRVELSGVLMYTVKPQFTVFEFCWDDKSVNVKFPASLRDDVDTIWEYGSQGYARIYMEQYARRYSEEFRFIIKDFLMN